MSQVNLNKTFNDVKEVLSISSDTTLLNTDSGKFVFVDASTGGNSFTITLPAVEAGLYFTFTLTADSAGDSQVLIDTPGSETIDGFAYTQDAINPVQDLAGVDSVGFEFSANKGSTIKLVCDGSGWYIAHASCDLSLITSLFIP